MSNADNSAKLSDIIAPAFYPVHWDIVDGKHTYYDLFGGRGSCKSSFVSVELVLGIMQDPLANGIVFRKVASTIGTSVFEQVLWAIDAMGVNDLWKATTSPYKLTYRPTGQVILFRGLDKAKKLKSIKVAHGYLKYCWLEELDEFAGEEEVRSVQQSVLRGGTKFVVFKSFNPPISRQNWANQYVITPRRNALRHKSCYLDAPRNWLGEQFFDDAESLKETNLRAYTHEYLGIPVGTGGEVFDNLEIREISDREIEDFEYIYYGLDFGWFPDPAHWVKVNFNAGKRMLYIFDELRVNKCSNRDLWEKLTTVKGMTGYDLLTADSAEPKSIADLRDYGAFCRGTIKGPDSVRYSMKWLQSMNKIVIDPVRCPEAAKEFQNYEYERTDDGDIISGYPDKDNHCLTGDTVVHTTAGDFPIAELVGKEGTLFCYDEAAASKAVSTFHDVRCTGSATIYRIELEDGRVLRCSGKHPVLTKRGWVLAEELTENDEIIQIGYKKQNAAVDPVQSVSAVKIKRITQEPREAVYNMEVDEHHNFAVNGGLIVHNSIDAVRYALNPVWKRKGL